MIRLGKRKEGSTWHILVEGMRTGSTELTQKNKVMHLFIIYQWIKYRTRLAVAVMKARLVSNIKETGTGMQISRNMRLVSIVR